MCEFSLADFNPVLNMRQLQEVLAVVVRVYKDNPPTEEGAKPPPSDEEDEVGQKPPDNKLPV